MNRHYEKTAALTFFVCFVIYTLACVMSPISWSPDGRWIALTRFLEEKKEGHSEADVTGSELWIVSPSPIERHRLMVTSGTMLSGPAWSNDSKSLYVVEFSEEEGTSGSVSLVRVTLDGQQRNLLRLVPTGDAEDVVLFRAPALSPDGRHIAFVRDDSAIVVAASDGRLERVIEADDALAVSWSHDGRWLCVIRGEDDGEPRVRFFDTKSSQTVALDARFQALAPLPDGKRFVAIKSQTEGTTETFFISVLEGMPRAREVRSFPIDFETGHPLVPSRKGNAVFFARGEEEDEDAPAIYRLDLRTGKVRVLHDSLGLAVPWSVSPDGKSLAFREQVVSGDDEEKMESIVGVLDLTGRTAPVYLAVDDEQLAMAIQTYAGKLKEISPDAELSPREKQLASLFYKRLERFLTAFRRDFPGSPLLEECAAQVEEVRAAFQKAGLRPSPDIAGPNR